MKKKAESLNALGFSLFFFYFYSLALNGVKLKGIWNWVMTLKHCQTNCT